VSTLQIGGLDADIGWKHGLTGPDGCRQSLNMLRTQPGTANPALRWCIRVPGAQAVCSMAFGTQCRNGVAAGSFAAQLKDQPVFPQPFTRQGEQVTRMAGYTLDLEFVNRQFNTVRDDGAFVIGQ